MRPQQLSQSASTPARRSVLASQAALLLKGRTPGECLSPLPAYNQPRWQGSFQGTRAWMEQLRTDHLLAQRFGRVVSQTMPSDVFCNLLLQTQSCPMVMQTPITSKAWSVP